jgi:DNA-directed RNA polymerase specialized sigma subunit
MTLAEIGAVIGVSESRISQLRSMAFTRLRASLNESLAGKAGRQAA